MSMGVKNSKLQNLIIFVIDIVGISIGYFIMTYIRFNGLITINPASMVIYRLIIAIFVLTLLYLLFYPNKDFFKRNFLQELVCNIKTNAMAAAFMATVAYLIDDARDYSRFIYLMTMGFSLVWMQVTHRLYRLYMLHFRKYSSMSRKMLIVTTSDRVDEVVHNIIKEKTWNLWVSGIIIIDKDMVGEDVQSIPVVANYQTMIQYAIRTVVDEVFIHVPDKEMIPVRKIISAFEDMGITVDLNIQLFEMDIDTEKCLDRIGGYNVVSFVQKDTPLHMLVIKRITDIIGACVGLVITGVITLFIAPFIKWESPGPLFFSQERVGKNGRIFRLYKFRSMYMDAEERKKELIEQNEMEGFMFKMENDPRITKLGKFLRKTSIDELPQFWNVLKGDMSLVGTRPPTVDEFEQYEGYHKRRLSMTPGLTGVWQVSGRNDIKDFEEIVKMDVDYISNWSLKRDFKIILRTVQVVLGSKGAR